MLKATGLGEEKDLAPRGIRRGKGRGRDDAGKKEQRNKEAAFHDGEDGIKAEGSGFASVFCPRAASIAPGVARIGIDSGPRIKLPP